MSDYRYAIEGYSDDSETPEFTNMVKTEFGKKLVEKRFKEQGLNVVIRKPEEAKGLNPYYEKRL